MEKLKLFGQPNISDNSIAKKKEVRKQRFNIASFLYFIHWLTLI